MPKTPITPSSHPQKSSAAHRSQQHQSYSDEPHAQKKYRSGFSYFLQGFSLALAPKTRRFIIIPLLLNIFVFGIAFIYLYQSLSHWIDYWLSYLPAWLNWLHYLLWPLIASSFILAFSYFFSTLTNWIASPFNGLLAEHIEAKLTGQIPPDTDMKDIIKDIPRVLVRESAKLWYFLVRAFILCILFFIPGLGQSIIPLLWFIFGAWMFSIQYCDFAFDNHRISFKVMRQAMYRHSIIQFTFGLCISIITMIPFLNLFIMPVAVCGGTAIWVDLYKEKVE